MTSLIILYNAANSQLFDVDALLQDIFHTQTLRVKQEKKKSQIVENN